MAGDFVGIGTLRKSMLKIIHILLFVGVYLSLSINTASGAPQIDFVGNVYCIVGHSIQPAGNITVELLHIPSEAAATKTTNGYYRKPAPFDMVYDHNVTLIYKVGNKVLHTEPVFVSKGYRLKRRGYSLIYKMDKVVINKSCDELDFDYAKYLARKQDEPEVINGYDGAFSFVELIRYIFVTLGAGFAGSPGESTINRVEKSTLSIVEQTPFNEGTGNLLSFSRNELFPSFGFRYSPSRTKAPSILTNPAALALESGAEISSDLKVNSGPHLMGNINASVPLSDRWVLGIGFYLNINKEYRTVIYDNEKKLDGSFKLSEYALLLSVSYRLTDNFAIGITNKYQSQRVENPAYVERTETYGYYSSDASEEELLSQVDSIVTKVDTNTLNDFDLSLAFDVLPKIRIGATLINVLGSKLIVNDKLKSNRGYGIGVTTFLDRYHFGFDIENTKRYGLNSSFGLSYIPINDWEFGVGYLTRGKTKKISIRYRSLYLSAMHGDVGCIYSVGSRFRF